MSDQMTLEEHIIQRIKRDGPISFHDFMEMALYFPGLGYYNAFQQDIGRRGDFYTSANLTPAFGAAIARQIDEMWRLAGTDTFTIVEFGAGTGILCQDILSYFKNNAGKYEKLHYCIIEKSDALRERQQRYLPEKVSWHTSPEAIPLTGACILSNELPDNFSVHRVCMQEQLMEVFVDYTDGFHEIYYPANPTLTGYFDTLGIALPTGFRTEVNLQAIEWLQQISATLQKGYLLTIDYGFTSGELYAARRSNGTLLCYHQHTINDNPYDHIGQQDITAHVNFSALMEWGNRFGLATCGLTSQAGFLLALGFKDLLRNSFTGDEDVLAMARKEASISYTLLVDMGSKYKVLIQQQGMPANELTGLKNRQPEAAAFTH